MRRYGRSQTDQGEVLDDCCYHVTFTPKVTLLELPFFQTQTPLSVESLKGNSNENLVKKPSNLMRETVEENQETTENILVPWGS